MKKLKLTAVLALMGASTAWGQTDVTKTYLTNADFESSTAIKSNLSTENGPCSDVSPGWVVDDISPADSKGNTYHIAGVCTYGSPYKLNSAKAPATAPTTGTKCLGMLAEWGQYLK